MAGDAVESRHSVGMVIIGYYYIKLYYSMSI